MNMGGQPTASATKWVGKEDHHFSDHSRDAPSPYPLDEPAPVPSLLPHPPSLPLAYSVPATPASSLFLQHTKHDAAPGAVFSAWNALPPDLSMAPSLPSFSSLLRYHLLSEAFPQHPV